MEIKKPTPQQLESWKKTKEKGIKTYQANLKKKREANKSCPIKIVGVKTTKKACKIRSKSKKESARYRKYLKIRKVWFEDPENKICKLHMTEECRESGESACDVHHTKGKIGELLFDTRFWLPGSRKCHRLIDEKTGEAKERGVVLSRHAK